MIDILLEPFNHLLRATDRIYWVYIVSAIVIAFVIFVRRADPVDDSLLGFFAWCFPKTIWQHRSTRTDVSFFVANRILFLVVFTPAVLMLFPIVNDGVQSLWLRVLEPPNWQSNVWVYVVYSVLIFFGLDFIRFVTHYLQHKVAFLWQFHRLHHSAEVLTPLTVYRMHPVDDLFPLTVAAVFLGAMHGTVSVLFVNDFTFYTFGLVSLSAMLFYLLGYSLRHSHIWLSYGPRVSRWLISPAQHQIHHCSLPEHRDRNMGFMLAIWDRLFGTLYVPLQKEELKLGLEDASSADTFANPWSCYLEPFQQNRGRAATLVVLLLLLGGATTSIATAQGWESGERSVWLDELTSVEVEEAIEAGFRTVIVPTGGVEYNGSHLTLGKHRRVVAHAAESMARKLGSTLVAPVIDFVPEGEISPPTGHMVHSGTITVRVSTFEAILEDVARSLFQHGIDRVIFIGDSGWNQDPQARVATRLNTELIGTAKRVIHLSAYYAANGQMQWLLEQGFSEDQVGFHAGMRDSSELLFVAAEAVRMTQLRTSGQRDNVSGSYWKANKDIGEKMLQLKVEASLKELAEIEKHYMK